MLYLFRRIFEEFFECVDVIVERGRPDDSFAIWLDDDIAWQRGGSDQFLLESGVFGIISPISVIERSVGVKRDLIELIERFLNLRIRKNGALHHSAVGAVDSGEVDEDWLTIFFGFCDGGIEVGKEVLLPRGDHCVGFAGIW